MGKVRVLVVEDSLTVRKRIVEVLSAAPDMEVVGEAEDGQRALELCQSLRPDVVTLDMMLPGVNGLAATERIMAWCPTPIVIVSSSTNRGELFKTYEALAAGAVDVLDKPSGDEPAGEWEQRFVSTVRVVARVKVITHLRARLVSAAPASRGEAGAVLERAAAAGALRAVALGTSTGGPGALVDVLRGLPRGFPLPILVVIHIGQHFASAFAEWLDGQSAFGARYAVDGEPLPPVGDPRVVIAPPDRHLVVSDGRLRLTRDAERHSCRPSVDVLFASLARELGSACAACLLTGMGRDGAEGLLALRQAGGRTIAQDEKTSVVFGMPREAIALGAAEQVLPLDRIAAALDGLCGGGGRRSS